MWKVTFACPYFRQNAAFSGVAVSDQASVIPGVAVSDQASVIPGVAVSDQASVISALNCTQNTHFK